MLDRSHLAVETYGISTRRGLGRITLYEDLSVYIHKQRTFARWGLGGVESMNEAAFVHIENE